MRLTPTQQKYLKFIHLIMASAWVSGAIALQLLAIPKLFVQSGGELAGIDTAIHWVDMGIVVVLGAYGCLITGFIYSAFTSWGFCKHRWILVKWIAIIAMILFGTFYLGVWEKEMLAISAATGLAALEDKNYLTPQWLYIGFGSLQTCFILFLVWISVMKPWKRNNGGNLKSEEQAKTEN